MRRCNRPITRLDVLFGRSAAVLLVLGALAALAPADDDAKPPPVQKKSKAPESKDGAAKKEGPKSAAVKLGLSINDSKAFQGYTLLAPMSSMDTFLLDMEGRVVHTWQSDSLPALCPLLLENGHLLRPGSIGFESRVFGPGPGVGGRIQEFTWAGKLVWDFQFYNAKQLPHHDMTRLPNGNVLLIVSDRKTAEEALAAGRRPEMIGESYLIPDSLVEIKPTGLTTGEVVWEWHLWDHLVQDFDKTKANYGNVREHPELVNINFGEDDLKPPTTAKTGQSKTKSADSKSTQAAAPRPTRINPDWTHFNGVAYNPELDQIAVSVYQFGEFWILDHSTTTSEAAGHSGGRCGKGGDLLYRWGNPHVYRAGTKADQKLFHQHNAHWIAKGLPGEGHLLLFNNGSGRQGENYSSVEELVLPVDSQGRYECKPGAAFGPDKPIWSYTAPKKTDFFSSFISGTQRLPNGNTLICSGANGTIFEVTPSKEVVWKYINPVKPGSDFGSPAPPGQLLSPVAAKLLGVSTAQRMHLDSLQKDVSAHMDKLLTAEQKKNLTEKGSGPGGFRPPGQPGQIMASAEQDRLKLTDAQKKDLASLQKIVDEQFDKALTPAQRKQIKNVFSRPGGPPPNIQIPVGSSGPALPGKIFSATQQETLKLSPDQKKRLEEIQKELDARLAILLTEEQQRQLRSMQINVAARPGGPGRGGPPPGGAPVFRAYRFSANHPAFAGKKWPPGKKLEEVQAKQPEKKEPQKQSGSP